MNDVKHSGRAGLSVVLVAVASFGAMVSLYFLRFLDDNRLVSWLDVFTVSDPGRFFGLLALALPGAAICGSIRWWERAPRTTLFLLSFSASAIFWGEPEVMLDAARYFIQAKHVSVYGAVSFFREWGRSLTAWTDLPLVPFIYGTVFSLFGESRAGIQVFNSLVFALSTVLTFQLGRKLWDDAIGFSGGLFLLSVPYLYVQAPLMMVDLAAMFFLLLALYTTLVAIDRGGRSLVFAIAAVSAACLTKYSLWLMLSVLGVAGAVAAARSVDRRRAVLRLFLVLTLAGAIMAILVWLKQDVFREQFGLLASYQQPGLRRWGESFFSTFFFQVHPAVTLCALASLFVAYLRRDAGYLVVLWTVLLVFILRVERIRYALVAFPMLCLMASYGLLRLKQGPWNMSVPWTSAAASLVLAASVYLPFLQGLGMANLMSVARQLDAMDAPAVEVVLSYDAESVADPAVLVPLLDLYSSKQIIHRARQAGSGMTDARRHSSLRFTWELALPQYYREGIGRPGSPLLILLTDDTARDLPGDIASRVSGLRLERSFDARDEVYQFQTQALVYR